MAIFLLKKSYQVSNQKEIGFKDLWGSHVVFTTIRLLGKPGKLILFKSHFKGLIKSLKNVESKVLSFISRETFFPFISSETFFIQLPP